MNKVCEKLALSNFWAYFTAFCAPISLSITFGVTLLIANLQKLVME